MDKIKIMFLPGGMYPPKQATPGSAGWDLYCPDPVILRPNEINFVRMRFALQIPEGHYISIVPRSSMGKRGVIIPNSPGTIDSDYTGEIMIMLVNINPDHTIEINAGERIAQMILHKYNNIEFEVTDVFKNTKRGSGGFGSTGK
jgi:dUTP pyrophosphatase